MPSMRHIHRYVKWFVQAGMRRKEVIRGGEPAYRCALPDCTHYTTRSMIVGKQSVCNVCNQIFIIDLKQSKLTEPRCINCQTTKEARAHQRASSIVKDILDTVPIKELVPDNSPVAVDIEEDPFFSTEMESESNDEGGY